jgi:hypothetical protein
MYIGLVLSVIYLIYTFLSPKQIEDHTTENERIEELGQQDQASGCYRIKLDNLNPTARRFSIHQLSPGFINGLI